MAAARRRRFAPAAGLPPGVVDQDTVACLGRPDAIEAGGAGDDDAATPGPGFGQQAFQQEAAHGQGGGQLAGQPRSRWALGSMIRHKVQGADRGRGGGADILAEAQPRPVPHRMILEAVQQEQPGAAAAQRLRQFLDTVLPGRLVATVIGGDAGVQQEDIDPGVA